MADIKGLILVGGYSKRMGQDKALLDYHGLPQYQFVEREMKAAGISNCFFSGRAEQRESPFSKTGFITDPNPPIGPLGGLRQAFKQFPNTAWLLLACDMPFLNRKGINYLVQQRKPNLLATAFESEAIQPLACIYEPGMIPMLDQAIHQKNYSLKRLLNILEVHKVASEKASDLLNVNDPETYKQIKQLMASGQNPLFK